MRNDKILKAIKNVEGASEETFLGFYKSKEDFAIAWVVENMRISEHVIKLFDTKKISKKLFNDFIFDKKTGAVFAPF